MINVGYHSKGTLLVLYKLQTLCSNSFFLVHTVLLKTNTHMQTHSQTDKHTHLHTHIHKDRQTSLRHRNAAISLFIAENTRLDYHWLQA